MQQKEACLFLHKSEISNEVTLWQNWAVKLKIHKITHKNMRYLFSFFKIF